MKKIISFIMAFILALGVLISIPLQSDGFIVRAAEAITDTEQATENKDENGFVFKLNEDGESYTVTGYTGPKVNQLNIPSSFNGKPVTIIGEAAFQFSMLFKSVIIPDTVTTIEYEAFSYTDVETVSIPESVTYIGKSAFAVCIYLRTVNIPSQIKVINEKTFTDCYKLNRIVLPEGLERIESSAFFGTGINSINIPDSVTYISFDAFECTGVVQNRSYYDGYGVFYLNKILMSSDWRTFPEMYTVKPGTTYINMGAFNNCEMVAITIPKSVKTIGNNAFSGCDELSMLFYEGTIEEFNEIDIKNNEQYLKNTVIVVNSTINKAPSKAVVKSVSNVAGGVQVKWGAVSGADMYLVWRRGTGSNSSWTLVGVTDQTSAIDSSAGHRQYWRYSVQPLNGAGFAPFDYTGRYLKYIKTPKLTGISNATDGIYFKWNSVSGASGYRVYRRAAGEKTWTYLTTVKGTSYIDKSVKNASGNYYRYTVRAVVDGVYSGYEDFLYIKRLANPTLKSATDGTDGITVKWSPVKGTTGYYVYRKTANSNWVRVAAIGGTNNTTFVDKTAVKGTTYTYTVRAVYGSTTSYFDSGISCKRK